jgi:predicted phosphohydrolase
MIIQYASDLHLEFPHNQRFLKTNPLQPKGEVLILAGDVVPFVALDQHKDFFDYLSDHFKVTYWIPGNHEYYQFDLQQKCGMINEAIRENVHLVNNMTVMLDEVQFIFSTLWSKISLANAWQLQRSISDFHAIRFNSQPFNAEQFNLQHISSLEFITRTLQQETAEQNIVVTHHVPTLRHYPQKYRGDVLNEAFVVELHELIMTTQPNYWIYGHHHFNTPDFNIGKTHMRTNQLGYVKYGGGQYFSDERTLEI